MRKFLLLVAGLSIGLTGYTQSSFPGKLILENGTLIKGEIKYDFSEKNPSTSIIIKIEGESEFTNFDLDRVEVIELENKAKYEKHRVLINRSSDDLDELDTYRKIELNEETLFLKVVLEGEKSLYSYKSNTIKRLFISNEIEEPKQLIYKRYYSSGNIMMKNEDYKQQLLNELNCNCLGTANFINTKYYQKEISNLFIKYYNCLNLDYVDYSMLAKKDLMNIRLRAGLNIGSYEVTYDLVESKNNDYGTSMTFKFGVEFEFFFNESSKKLAFIAEPGFQSYKSEMQVGAYLTSVDYKSIELPIGLRYYVGRTNFKTIINAGVLADFAINSRIQPINAEELKIRNRFSAFAGLGFTYDRFIIEGRYSLPANTLAQYGNWNGSYSTLSIMAGYQLK